MSRIQSADKLQSKNTFLTYFIFYSNNKYVHFWKIINLPIVQMLSGKDMRNKQLYMRKSFNKITDF